MKSKVRLFAVWGVILLLSKWFFNELYNLFTPFLVIVPLLALLVSFFVFGIMAVLFAVKNKMGRLKAFTPLFIFVFVAFLYVFVPFDFAKIKLEHIMYADKRERIVADIQSNALSCNGFGNVRLPFGYRSISVDGEAKIIENSGRGIVVGFWVFRGLHMNPYQMVVYTSYGEPLSEETLGIIRLYEHRKLGENWYYIRAY